MGGIVEQFGKSGIAGWAVTAEDPSERVLIKVNDITVATTAPRDPVSYNGEQRDYGFKRQVAELWKYLGRGDSLHVEYGGQPLPISGTGYLHKFRADRPSNFGELASKLDQGYVLNKYGQLRLSIQKDFVWQKLAVETLQNVSRDLQEKFGYAAFPFYGTMLGAVREENYISHDNDFDAVYISRLSSATEVKQEYYAICEYLIDKGYNLKVKGPHTWVRFSAPTEMAGKSPIYKFDLFFAWFSEDGNFQVSYGYHHEPLVRSDDFFKLKPWKLGKSTVLMPQNSEQILGQLYGPEWRTPDPGFKHHSPTRKVDLTYYLKAAQRSALHWKQFYRDNQVSGGSSFAKFVSARLQPKSLVIEIGCGTGRDANFFAQHNHAVLAADRSPEGIVRANETKTELGLNNLEFAVADASSAEQLVQLFSSETVQNCNKAKRPVVIYMRFFLHSIPLETQNKIFDEVCKAFRGHVSLALEFRTEKDADLKKAFGEHYRRYIPMADVVSDLKKRGFKISFSEEGFGFSPYKDEDPHLARILAEK